MMFCGPRVRGGLLGQAPTDSDLGQGNLPYYVDFRGVYANVIRHWLGFDPNPIFQLDGETYDENIGGSLIA
jgi:hypothetical protein